MERNKRPQDTDFKQQRLRSWQPILTPPYVIGTFFCVGIVFPIIGIVCLLASGSVVEAPFCYQSTCPTRSGAPCSFQLKVDREMKPPVYFYYRLTNFYQNHRRYINSRSNPQLQGDVPYDGASCDPLEFSNVNTSKIMYPCGLIAGSLFTDTFELYVNGNIVPWTGNGIAWKTDVDTKFKARPIRNDESNLVDQNGNIITLPPVNDEDLIVWMRTAGLPTFRKLYRIIDTTIPVGTHTVVVNSTYDVSTFGGNKCVVLSTTSWLGGKNQFLGIAYIVVGAVSLVIAIVFLIKNAISPRTLGDADYLHMSKGGSKEVEMKE